VLKLERYASGITRARILDVCSDLPCKDARLRSRAKAVACGLITLHGSGGGAQRKEEAIAGPHAIGGDSSAHRACGGLCRAVVHFPPNGSGRCAGSQRVTQTSRARIRRKESGERRVRSGDGTIALRGRGCRLSAGRHGRRLLDEGARCEIGDRIGLPRRRIGDRRLRWTRLYLRADEGKRTGIVIGADDEGAERTKPDHGSKRDRQGSSDTGTDPPSGVSTVRNLSRSQKGPWVHSPRSRIPHGIPQLHLPPHL
jgi:hypothetical protein